MKSGPRWVSTTFSGLHDLISEAGAEIVGIIVFLFASHHTVILGGENLIKCGLESACEPGIGRIAIERVGAVDESRETARRKILVGLGLGAVDLGVGLLKRGLARGPTQEIFAHLAQGGAGAS